MSRPAYTQTFDTSEMDLQGTTQDNHSETTTVVDSFSTSSSGDIPKSSAVADITTPSQATTATSNTLRQVQRLPTSEAYDAWASTYDTDGNILQAMDDLALQDSLLPQLFEHLASTLAFADTPTHTEPLRITDLGCGTGRATLALLSHLQTPTPALLRLLRRPDRSEDRRPIHITGLDSSPGMLAVARSRVPHTTHTATTTVHASFHAHDILAPPTAAGAGQHPHAILATLVLEHTPLPAFFAHLASAFPSARALVLSNMHPGMPDARPGTQAGFNTAKGAKVLAGESVAHGVREVVEAAEGWGWSVRGGVEERAVEGWMVQGEGGGRRGEGTLGERGRKWVGVVVWFGGVFVR